MSEYSFVEKPFLDQLDALGWQVIDQGRQELGFGGGLLHKRRKIRVISQGGGNRLA